MEKVTRRNFLFTVLGIGAVVKAVKPEKKQLTKTKNFMITRRGHIIEFWNDGKLISEDEFPFEYSAKENAVRIKRAR